MRPTCSVDDCDSDVFTLTSGLCGKHYARWRTHGDPLAGRVRGPNHQPGDTCTITGCDQELYGRGWCKFHYTRWLERGTTDDPVLVPTETRFWARVDRSGGELECWPWDHPEPNGYGSFEHDHIRVGAHRYAYELVIGPIPTGLQIDHLCHTSDETCPGGPTCPHRRCVNPAHLETVTSRMNVLRGLSIQAKNAEKTHCDKRHEFTAANTIIDKRGRGTGRFCRTCVNDRKRAKRAAARAHQLNNPSSRTVSLDNGIVVTSSPGAGW